MAFEGIYSINVDSIEEIVEEKLVPNLNENAKI